MHPVVINQDRLSAPALLICEHASNHVPDELEGLGVEPEVLDQHIAYDIGTEMLTHAIADRLNCPAVIATVSRLVIDANRYPDHPGLIPEISDGIVVPGNSNLDDLAREARQRAYFEPFHSACAEQVIAMIRAGHRPFVVGVHSFTPVMEGFERPWHAGILHDADPRLANHLIAGLRDAGYEVGDNEPYSGRELFHTIAIHGAVHGLPHATVEVRQDLLAYQEQADKWADTLVGVLQPLFDHPELAEAT